MLLAIDVGNSTIKFGIYEGAELIHKFAVPTHRDYSPEELLLDRLRLVDDRLVRIDYAFVSSVVPELDDTIRSVCRQLYNVTPVFIDSEADWGMKIDYDPVSSVGTDRLLAAFAAVGKYGKPCIICSFGTATTIDALNSAGEFLGGVIAPGMAVMADSLNRKTSKLPRVEIKKPENVIGKSTVSAIRSGIFHGHIGLVNILIERIASELGEKPNIVATGGFAEMIAPECPAIDVVDDILVLEGLRLMFKRSEMLA